MFLVSWTMQMYAFLFLLVLVSLPPHGSNKSKSCSSVNCLFITWPSTSLIFLLINFLVWGWQHKSLQRSVVGWQRWENEYTYARTYTCIHICTPVQKARRNQLGRVIFLMREYADLEDDLAIVITTPRPSQVPLFLVRNKIWITHSL